MSDGHFSENIAKTYDELHGKNPNDLALSVACLQALADDGRVLEFAIGTGRVALPLAAAGCDVSGIEMSRAMVAELRKKETSAPLHVTIGDMSKDRVDGAFSLVFLVFNTFDNLTTQDAQIACFANAARHLAPGGRFLIETQVPPLRKIPMGSAHVAFSNGPGHLGIDRFNLAEQTYTSSHIRHQDGHAEIFTVPFRYAWPAEMDLMARMTGLSLEYRWEDWDRTPFTAESSRHISVWRKPA